MIRQSALLHTAERPMKKRPKNKPVSRRAAPNQLTEMEFLDLVIHLLRNDSSETKAQRYPEQTKLMLPPVIAPAFSSDHDSHQIPSFELELSQPLQSCVDLPFENYLLPEDPLYHLIPEFANPLASPALPPLPSLEEPMIPEVPRRQHELFDDFSHHGKHVPLLREKNERTRLPEFNPPIVSTRHDTRLPDDTLPFSRVEETTYLNKLQIHEIQHATIEQLEVYHTTTSPLKFDSEPSDSLWGKPSLHDRSLPLPIPEWHHNRLLNQQSNLHRSRTPDLPAFEDKRKLVEPPPLKEELTTFPYDEPFTEDSLTRTPPDPLRRPTRPPETIDDFEHSSGLLRKKFQPRDDPQITRSRDLMQLDEDHIEPKRGSLQFHDIEALPSLDPPLNLDLQCQREIQELHEFEINMDKLPPLMTDSRFHPKDAIAVGYQYPLLETASHLGRFDDEFIGHASAKPESLPEMNPPRYIQNIPELQPIPKIDSFAERLPLYERLRNIELVCPKPLTPPLVGFDALLPLEVSEPDRDPDLPELRILPEPFVRQESLQTTNEFASNVDAEPNAQIFHQALNSATGYQPFQEDQCIVDDPRALPPPQQSPLETPLKARHELLASIPEPSKKLPFEQHSLIHEPLKELTPINLQEKTFLEKIWEAEIQEDRSQRLVGMLPAPDFTPIHPAFAPRALEPNIVDLPKPQLPAPEPTINEIMYDALQEMNEPSNLPTKMRSFYDQEPLYRNPSLEQMLGLPTDLDPRSACAQGSTKPFGQHLHNHPVNETHISTYEQQVDDSFLQDMHGAANSQEVQNVEKAPADKEPLRVYNFSDGMTQLHLHNNSAAGHFEHRNREIKEVPPLNGFESAMADYYAQEIGLPFKDVACDSKKKI